MVSKTVILVVFVVGTTLCTSQIQKDKKEFDWNTTYTSCWDGSMILTSWVWDCECDCSMCEDELACSVMEDELGKREIVKAESQSALQNQLASITGGLPGRFTGATTKKSELLRRKLAKAKSDSMKNIGKAPYKK